MDGLSDLDTAATGDGSRVQGDVGKPRLCRQADELEDADGLSFPIANKVFIADFQDAVAGNVVHVPHEAVVVAVMVRHVALVVALDAGVRREWFLEV